MSWLILLIKGITSTHKLQVERAIFIKFSINRIFSTTAINKNIFCSYFLNENKWTKELEIPWRDQGIEEIFLVKSFCMLCHMFQNGFAMSLSRRYTLPQIMNVECGIKLNWIKRGKGLVFLLLRTGTVSKMN